MAIAPSKLGKLVLRYWDSERALLRGLREAGLVNPDASDDDLRAVFRKAREEHAGIPEADRIWNSPNERVRVFLEPYFSEKGRLWAAPLISLELPDDPPSNRRPWWRFW
jgi:hypothetical protein